MTILNQLECLIYYYTYIVFITSMSYKLSHCLFLYLPWKQSLTYKDLYIFAATLLLSSRFTSIQNCRFFGWLDKLKKIFIAIHSKEMLIGFSFRHNTYTNCNINNNNNPYIKSSDINNNNSNYNSSKIITTRMLQL